MALGKALQPLQNDGQCAWAPRAPVRCSRSLQPQTFGCFGFSGGHYPRYANYWAPLTRKPHPLHPAQPRHTNHWALRTRKRHQQEHRPQRPTERSDATQHAKGRTSDCPGPRAEATTGRNVTRGGGGGGWFRGRGPDDKFLLQSPHIPSPPRLPHSGHFTGCR